jgi:hypothetical protein
MTLKGILTLILVSLLNIAAVGQDEPAQISVQSNPPGATVTIEGEARLSGVTPAAFHQTLIGDYLLKVSRSGFETYSSRVMLSPDRPIVINVDLVPKTRFKAAARSVFIPGWGQRYSEHNGRRMLFTGLAVAAVGYYLMADADFDDKNDVFLDRLSQYDASAAGGSLADLKWIQPRLDKAQREAWDAENRRRFAIGMVVAVWGWSVLDALLLFPENRAEISVKGLSLVPTTGLGQVGLKLSRNF